VGWRVGRVGEGWVEARQVWRCCIGACGESVLGRSNSIYGIPYVFQVKSTCNRTAGDPVLKCAFELRRRSREKESR
jgi:hypothetical protein